MTEKVPTIPITVNDLSEAPESHRRLYTKAEDGTFTLDGGGVFRALEEERAEAKKWKEEAKKYEGIDPVEAKEWKEAAELAEREKDIQRGNFEKVLNKEKEAWKESDAIKDQRIAKLEAGLNNALIDAAALREITARDGRPKLLLHEMTKQLKLMELNGETIAVVVNSKGEPRLKAEPEHAHDYMGPAELAIEMKADPEYAPAWAGTGSSGSGAPSMKLTTPTAKTTSEIEKIQAQVQRGRTGRLTS